MRAGCLAVPIGDAAVAGVALGAAWALKAFYSHADADALGWILAPTVRLVSLSTGVAFEPEPHQGYLCREQMFLVAPACAGVNFLIVAFVSLALGLVHVCSSDHARVRLLLASAAAAYAATVLANATRIAFALRLHEAGAAFGPLTPERLHCALGVAVYFLFLLFLFSVAARVTGVRHGHAG
ncbi:MAG TPA: exosortase K [Methylomirabilota bacterium]|nr:exosortase K [Methylomirabilota bacterium]